MTDANERIKVSLDTQDKIAWGVNLLLLLGKSYPDARGEQRIVRVEDTAAGKRWTIEVRDAAEGRRVRDKIEETARRMSDAELDEWARTGRWTTWA